MINGHLCHPVTARRIEYMINGDLNAKGLTTVCLSVCLSVSVCVTCRLLPTLMARLTWLV